MNQTINRCTFLSLAHQKKLRCEKFLDEMDAVIPWQNFLKKIDYRYYKNQDKEAGRNKYDLKLMLKIYCLQQWYNLSDPAMEEAIYDRYSFQRFLGIDLLDETVPDETTILNFRHFLEHENLQKKIFNLIKEILENNKYIMKTGSIVDATIISAPMSTKNEKKKRDPEMSFTAKNNNIYFGMKLHCGVDADSGLIHHAEITTAKTHDKTMMAELFYGEEKRKFGDKGYYSEADKREARANEIFWGILDKGKRGHKLSNSQKKRNKKLATVRAKVEHPFRVIKDLWFHRKVRYKGLSKNAGQMFMLCALANLFMVRKKLLAVA